MPHAADPLLRGNRGIEAKLNCREVTALVLGQRVGVRVHTMVCKACPRFWVDRTVPAVASRRLERLASLVRRFPSDVVLGPALDTAAFELTGGGKGKNNCLSQLEIELKELGDIGHG